MIVLGIDPSINTLGLALIEKNTATGIMKLLSLTTIVAPTKVKKGTDEIRLLWMLSKVSVWLKDVKPDIVLIERPQSWGAYKSVASEKSGALLILHIIVGALFWWGEMIPSKVLLIPVSKWKGQLPKSVTQQQMEQLWGKDVFKTDHEADALGICNWYLTNLKGD